jgi:hypothetical protein
MRMRALLVALALDAAACQASVPQREGRASSLRLHGHPPDATVTIDDELVGSLALVTARGVALRPGTHQVTVQAPGYFPWDHLVVTDTRTAGKRIELDVELIKVPE